MKTKPLFKGLDLGHLRCFQVLYAERSVTAAASVLNMSQSWVSGALAKLRTALGDPLFVRLPHGLMPTEHCHTLAASIDSILNEVEQMLRSEPEPVPETTSRTIRVCATDQIQASVLIRNFSRIRNKAPNIKLQLIPPHPQHAQDWLRDGDIDLAIGSPKVVLREFRTHLLYQDSFVCIASRTNRLLSGSKQISLETLCEMEHYEVSTATGSYYSSTIEDAFFRTKRLRKVAVTGESFLLAAYAVETSDLLAIVPRTTAVWCSAKFKIAVFDLPLPVPPFDVCLYWHERTHKDPIQRWLRNQLVNAGKIEEALHPLDDFTR
ncbi:LysR family transcriptional regulator [Paraburkholderia panacisoli]|uniref:LysR family transcriptional regulator n=1 Tax=Paraburkholderia panacisoli TaxID=2603818 RepID=A0A5B0FY01_9BURK|nr:LysR family transcriptional regulator [Paraburkholderia panacisoli]KAA0996143.1 LysR family transcriptional regulator [Paraburkholderia panacisoli]